MEDNYDMSPIKSQTDTYLDAHNHSEIAYAKVVDVWSLLNQTVAIAVAHAVYELTDEPQIYPENVVPLHPKVV